MVPNSSQASVCDEQLMSVGGEMRCQETLKNEKKLKNGKNEK